MTKAEAGRLGALVTKARHGGRAAEWGRMGGRGNRKNCQSTSAKLIEREVKPENLPSSFKGLLRFWKETLKGGPSLATVTAPQETRGGELV